MSNLNTASEHLVEDVSPFLHDADVVRRGVGTLAVLDWIDESVSELLDGPQQVLLDEVHHAVVCEWEESHGFETRAMCASVGSSYGDSVLSHSIRLFCRGVPVRTTRLRVLMEFMAFDTAEASFFKM